MQTSWDPQDNIQTTKILPGEFYVTRENERIETVLGSCIAACVRDPIARVGGMNHFMLPADKGSGNIASSDANRYGNFAMENLINELLHKGASRERLEFKIFGGGRIMNQSTNVGWMNIGFTFDYIYTEGFKLVSQDIGDIFPRKVMYYPSTGRVRMRKLEAVGNQRIVEEENRYMKNVSASTVGGDVELF